ncbi:MAG TPA: hypothetical protein PKM73_09290 [Verrucomicrobiota bacterium]|nr:hypothetical protein [Verrucomicrobiota bacterium]HNU51999.1 hypothetical protein [Verrucomicrobiota bacterium]
MPPRYYRPDEFQSRLFDWAWEDPSGGEVERGKPRKRAISLDAAQLSEEERSKREGEMLKRIADAMKHRPGG